MPRSAAALRQRILDEVTRLFVEKGYHGVGIQEISDAVGLKRGGLYHHIGSKELLLFEISMTLLRQATEITEPIVADDGPPDARLRALARALLRHHLTHGDGWSVAIHEARFLSDEHRKEVIAARDEFEQIWRDVLDEGAARGLWRPVDGVDVRGILGTFNSAARWLRPDGPLPPEQIADRYVDLLLDGLRPREPRGS
ncbi:TetR/AcrR family transcriptional regulator [Frankia sp. AgB1.9]|uniref:TetR/AcrR family transcriptional regulator n=1 Tax=unclassified Frankia TaxID=2632575 RepID=UPI00193334DC|nr:MULTISPECIES: TetR/AcrR family transcriptional regulator [unclassified Frankia]MBL7488174.1 TetR/AcrR family transcriptional regulator [Frankia sp. AgW1.1]MBL7553228.1 TetR/AcrR family transcriptional regulator [Frankia sp. AgB1.9]MBL7620177.1 TetR/AcrR family transcriptional regulator [Frankia sp. AgB1.8]